MEKRYYRVSLFTDMWDEEVPADEVERLSWWTRTTRRIGEYESTIRRTLQLACAKATGKRHRDL